MVLSRIIFIAVNLISDLSAKEWEMTGRSIAMPMVFCDFDVSVPVSQAAVEELVSRWCRAVVTFYLRENSSSVVPRTRRQQQPHNNN